MAPNFLSKLVKSSPVPSPQRPSTEERSRNSSPVRTSTLHAHSSAPSPGPSMASLHSSNSGLDVNVVPPSPSDSDRLQLGPDASPSAGRGRGATDRARAISLVVHPPSPDGRVGGPSPAVTPTPANPAGTPLRSAAPRMLRHSSSMNEIHAPDDLERTPRSPLANGTGTGHGRYNTTDAAQVLVSSPRGSLSTNGDDESASGSVYGAMAPIVESPKTENRDFFTNMPSAAASTTTTRTAGSALLSAPDNSDAVSVYSVTTGKKKRPWRRSASREPAPAPAPNPPTSPKDKRKRDRKPTGLAAALASTGMAMANPAAGPTIAGSMSPPRRSESLSSGAPAARHARRSGSISSNINGAPAANNRHLVAQAHAPRGSLDLPVTPRSRAGSVSEGSRSELDSVDGRTEDTSSSDELDLDDDIPVTGFAVASSKRNADFHDLFPEIPEGDYLIEDYGCALARDILVQGRLYISENHLCFHANIFGWITDVSIPIYEVVSLEKKMTALIIPNAIMITTRDNKYTFASFMSRDTTYDVIHNVWRLGRPASALASRDDIRRKGTDESRGILPAADAPAAAGGAPAVKKVTTCGCGKAGEHYSATAMEAVYPGTPEKIYNLMFASGFIKDFMRDEQKLLDIQVSDWTPSSDSKLLARNMSYIKPLNGSIGPRQTKCELKDETVHFDVENYISTLTTTRTPEVPSGTVFSVKTRTCITWASSMSAKVLVTTQIEWTGRSFIKGIIERSALDGQNTYHADLDKAMRAYIHAHPTEFIPEGVDANAIEAVAIEEPTSATSATSAMDADGTTARERQRSQRSLQWAYDTFEGAMKVAKQSAEGALDLLSDAWDGSSATTVLYFLVAFLVVSNVWTLAMMGRREEAGRRKAVLQADKRERWVQSIVDSLWEERASLRAAQHQPVAAIAPANPDWREEVAEIHKALDAVDTRMQGLRKGLLELN